MPQRSANIETALSHGFDDMAKSSLSLIDAATRQIQAVWGNVENAVDMTAAAIGKPCRLHSHVEVVTYVASNWLYGDMMAKLNLSTSSHPGLVHRIWDMTTRLDTLQDLCRAREVVQMLIQKDATSEDVQFLNGQVKSSFSINKL